MSFPDLVTWPRAGNQWPFRSIINIKVAVHSLILTMKEEEDASLASSFGLQDSSHLEGGHSGHLHLRLHLHSLPVSTGVVGDLHADLARTAAGSSLASGSQWAAVALHLHQDIGGVVVLVTVRVVLGLGEGAWILELSVARPWPLLVPSRASQAGGEVANLLLLSHADILAFIAEVWHRQVLAGVEHWRGDLTACWAV